jgi:hypothetical protein
MNDGTRIATIRLGALALVALGVASCGGGGGGDGFAGIDRLGVSTGTVTGFGSIFVNGVEWETDGATITVDDDPGAESDLRVGQVVTVRGELNSAGTVGTADSVEFDNSLEGPVASIDLPAGTFVVLGQTVVTSAETQFDDSIPDRQPDGRRTLDDLAEDDVVEVSGYRDAAGAVRATRVAIRGGASIEYEVKGVVSGLNTGTTTFAIGTLQVNYAGATLEDFGSDTLSNGDFVEVEGTVAGNLLTASKVELEDDLGGDDGDEGELEGFITSFTSAASFEVNGVPVTTNSGTGYEGGTSANLGLNVKVEVEGEFNASGVLVADKVEFRIGGEDADVEVAGSVDTVNVGAGTFTIEGLDVVIRTDGATRFEDDSDDDEGDGSFNLAELMAGDYVEVRGAEDASTGAANDVIAIRIERDDADDEVVLQGPIQAEAEPELTILGVTVATDFAQFRDEDGDTISEAAFFGAVGIGDVVKARAAPDNVVGNVMIADEVEIEELD